MEEMLTKLLGSIGAVGIYATIKHWWNILSKIAEAVIPVVEKAAKDNIISPSERKEIAMKAIIAAEKQGLIKLNILSRLFVSIVVGKIAKKLPNFNLSQNVNGLVDDAIKENKNGK